MLLSMKPLTGFSAQQKEYSLFVVSEGVKEAIIRGLGKEWMQTANAGWLNTGGGVSPRGEEVFAAGIAFR